MGWTSCHAYENYRNGKPYIDRKVECDRIFNDNMVTYTKPCQIIGKFEVLKSSMVGSTYYAAVKRTKFATEIEPEESIVFAAICLTSTDMKSYYNFSYKDMDETCGPYECKCPVGILKLLTPTDNEYANEWRQACWNYHNKKKKLPNDISNLRVGSKVKFTANGIEFIMRKEYGCAHIRNGVVKRIDTIWTNGYNRATTRCIKSWGYEVLHEATKEEEKVLREQKLANVHI